jgi:hypothetical protein
VPAWAWLACIVVLSAAIRIALGRRLPAPWIKVDELIYSELAKSFAAHGHCAVRGAAANGYGVVYPVLIAPAWRLFTSAPRAYEAAKVIDSVVMSLVAVPAYLLARRLLPSGLALAAAALAVLVPSMLYTGTVMTENAFYPLFVLAVLALVAALEGPTVRRQLTLLVLCALAYATRAQGLALFAAIAGAPIVHGAIERDLRGRVRPFVPLYAGLVAVAVFLLGVEVARGRSPLDLLGAYRAATSSHYDAHTVARYLLWHVAELDLYLGIVPFAALLAVWLAPRGLAPASRAFAAATLSVVVALVVEVAVFASQPSVARIEERSMFYVAPLALVTLLGLASDGVVPRSRRTLVAASAVAGVLPATIPLARFLNPSAVADTLALSPWWSLRDHGIHAGDLRWLALACGLAAAAAFLAVPPRRALVLPVLVGVYFVVTAAVAENGRHGMRRASVASLRAGIGATRRDWIDRTAGAGADVAVLWPSVPETHPLWENEFFNRSVHTVYSIDGPDPWDGNLPETPVRLQASGAAVAAGGVVRVRYALAGRDLAGRLLARDPGTGLQLYRVDGPLVVLTRIEGLYPGDTWAGTRVTYRRRRCAGGLLSVELQTDARLFDGDQTITASAGGTVVGRTRIEPTRRRLLTVPLRVGPTGTCEVTFTAATTRVPALVDPALADRRRLAAHYLSFRYSPP